MRKAIEVIQEMEEAGLFRSYAVGGGVGAMFYMEAFATYDLDVFILVNVAPNGLISLDSIYSWLRERGYKPDKEQVMIEGIPVQFLVAYNPLIEEAVERAEIREFEGFPVRVVAPVEPGPCRVA